MKKLLFLSLVIVCATSCQQQGNKPKVNATDAFDSFRKTFVEKLWVTYPGWATGVGYHKYDSILTIPDEANRNKELEFAKWTEDQLKNITFDSLNANDKTDYRLVQNLVDGTRFSINEFKGYEWQPSEYNIGNAMFAVIDYKGNSLDDRLRDITKKLAKVPAYYEAAKKNIKKPTLEHTKLAIEQNKGSYYFFEHVFPDSLKASKLNDAEKATFETNANAAKAAIEGYVKWLEDLADEKKMALRSTTPLFSSFRIGKDLYGKKFKMDIQSRYTADEMYKKAVDRKDFLHKEMSKLTDELWPKYMASAKAPADTLAKIKMLIDKLSLQHCKKEDFLATVEKQLPELTAFITAHHIIDPDSTKPIKVRKTPDYEAGVAGAGIESPGPYDKGATTYYNVTPLTNYTPEKAESYLREYNDYVLQILNIHEAIPGHYTQLIYSNRSPSIIKAILGNGAMVEGWACYVERMMVEEGYGKSPEMQLFYDKWNLRECCNFLLDYNIHCNNWTEKQVLDLLVNEGFQQSAEASEKYKRASLTQVQLTSYFTGLTEIYDLREEMKAKQGAKFDLKKFHEQFLSYGSAPVKEIRELMTRH